MISSLRICIAAALLLSAAAAAPGRTGQAAPVANAAAAARDRVPASFEPLVLHLGAQGQPGNAVSLPARLGGAVPTPLLSDVTWLPVDFVGRTHLDRLLPDRPLHRTDVPGASRLVLPRGEGALYRYRRQVEGAELFGFFVVADGRGRVVHERRGTGAGFSTDPWVARVAVAPDGRALLAATTAAAGGDLLEIDLADGHVHDRTAGMPAMDFSDAGLWLNGDWGFGVTTQGVQRFSRQPAAVAAPVDFGAAPPVWYSGEAVVSVSRDFAATTAGTGVDAQLPWVFGRTGPALPASDTPERLAGAGFLPEAPHGPFLAVSDDGALCGWKRQAATTAESNEGFLGRAQAVPIAPAQYSGDQYVLDTVDEVGIIGFLRPALLVIGIGERDAVEGIDTVEFFGVSLMPDGSPVHTNLSATSGDTTVPFDTEGNLDPTAVLRTADGRLLLHDDEGERVLLVDPDSTGVQVLLAQARLVDWFEPSGGHLLLSVERAFDPRPRELWSLDPALSAATLELAASPQAAFLHPVNDGAGGFALVYSEPLTGQRPARLRLPGGALELAGPVSPDVVPPLALFPEGALVYHANELGGGPTWYRWPRLGTAAHEAVGPAGAGHVLPSR